MIMLSKLFNVNVCFVYCLMFCWGLIELCRLLWAPWRFVLQLGLKRKAKVTLTLSPALLSGLNEKLEDSSYIEGWQYSAADDQLWRQLKASLQTNFIPSRYPHLSRWYHHIGSLNQSEPAQVSNAWCMECLCVGYVWGMPGEKNPILVYSINVQTHFRSLKMNTLYTCIQLLLMISHLLFPLLEILLF